MISTQRIQRYGYTLTSASSCYCCNRIQQHPAGSLMQAAADGRSFMIFTIVRLFVFSGDNFATTIEAIRRYIMTQMSLTGG